MSYVVKVVRRDINTEGKKFASYRTITNQGNAAYVCFVRDCVAPEGNVLIRVDSGDYSKEKQKLYVESYVCLRNLSPEEVKSVEPDRLEGLFNVYDDESYLDTAKV